MYVNLFEDKFIWVKLEKAGKRKIKRIHFTSIWMICMHKNTAPLLSLSVGPKKVSGLSLWWERRGRAERCRTAAEGGNKLLAKEEESGGKMARATKGSLTVAVAICARVRGGAVLSPTSLSSCRNLHSSGRKDDSRRQEYSTGAAAAVEVEGGIPGGLRRLPGRQGWDLAGAIEYLEYRRSLYGEITHKALLVDAVGTLVAPSQPMAQVWLFSLPHGKGDYKIFINFQKFPFLIDIWSCFVGIWIWNSVSLCFSSIWKRQTDCSVLLAMAFIFIHLFALFQIYRQIGEKYGVKYSENEILNRYRWAYEQPWGRSRLRFVFPW